MTAAAYLSARSTRAALALALLVVSLPFLLGAIYGALHLSTVAVPDNFAPTYEQFRIGIYERMDARDLLNSGLSEEDALRRTYDQISETHWRAASEIIQRDLLFYGSLFLLAAVWLLIEYRASRH